jgi:Transposase DDE domain
VRVRALGGDRAGEMRITRFLRHRRVSVGEMVATALARTAALVAGRQILAIQDTTSLRDDGKANSLVLHPTIAVDARDGALLGLVHADLLRRSGGQTAARRSRPVEAKQSRRWLDGTRAAAELAATAGAARVTVIADREGDIYEEFACKPARVELLIRAGQDRRLAESDGERLFSCTDRLPELGRMTVQLAAAPGRPARPATLALRCRQVTIARPKTRRARGSGALPAQVTLTLVEAREIDPPAGATPAHWRLLTTHRVDSLEDAQRIVGFYRERWTIEQLFRVMKTKGFDIEAVRIADLAPFENLATATLVAAIQVLQLVRDREGAARRPLADVFDAADQPILEAVCATLEGKTARQKNPHPTGSLAYAAWVCARLGGWTGYYGKPGPIVILDGLKRFKAIAQGWAIRELM